MNHIWRDLVTTIIGAVVVGLTLALFMGVGYLSQAIFGVMFTPKEVPQGFVYGLLLFCQGLVTVFVLFVLWGVSYTVGHSIRRRRR